MHTFYRTEAATPMARMREYTDRLNTLVRTTHLDGEQQIALDADARSSVMCSPDTIVGAYRRDEKLQAIGLKLDGRALGALAVANKQPDHPLEVFFRPVNGRAGILGTASLFKDPDLIVAQDERFRLAAYTAMRAMAAYRDRADLDAQLPPVS